MQKRKRIAAFLCAAALTASVPVSAAGEPLTSNGMGLHEGYNYELWMDVGGGEGSMTLNEGGAYSCQWTDAQNVLFRTGKKFDSTQTHDELGEISLEYGAEYFPNGNSYLCVYGWSVDPLVEFYVVESWGSWRPPGAESKGTIEVDGGTYDVYETTRFNQPSIQGTQTFQQYWSVRTERKTEGTVSVSEHIKVWENMGMTLGNIYEVALCVEGYQSSGVADVYTNVLTVGGVDIAEETPSPSPEESPSPSAEPTPAPTPAETEPSANGEQDSSGVPVALIIAIAAVLLCVIVAVVVRLRKKGEQK